MPGFIEPCLNSKLAFQFKTKSKVKNKKPNASNTKKTKTKMETYGDTVPPYTWNH